MGEYMKSLLFLITALIILCGCEHEQPIPQQPKKIIKILKKDAPIVQNIKIIEGKTTRQELLDKLGTPNSVLLGSYNYDYGNTNVISRVEIYTTNNENFNIELCDKKNGCKHTYMNITFKFNRRTAKFTNIVDKVTFH